MLAAQNFLLKGITPTLDSLQREERQMTSNMLLLQKARMVEEGL